MTWIRKQWDPEYIVHAENVVKETVGGCNDPNQSILLT
jgi:hypothetical protein